MADKGKDKLQGDTSSRKVQYVFERPDSMGAVEGEEGSVPQHLASKADQGGGVVEQGTISDSGKAGEQRQASAAADEAESPQPISPPRTPDDTSTSALINMLCCSGRK